MTKTTKTNENVFLPIVLNTSLKGKEKNNNPMFASACEYSPSLVTVSNRAIGKIKDIPGLSGICLDEFKVNMLALTCGIYGIKASIQSVSGLSITYDKVQLEKAIQADKGAKLNKLGLVYITALNTVSFEFSNILSCDQDLYNLAIEILKSKNLSNSHNNSFGCFLNQSIKGSGWLFAFNHEYTRLLSLK